MSMMKMAMKVMMKIRPKGQHISEPIGADVTLKADHDHQLWHRVITNIVQMMEIVSWMRKDIWHFSYIHG